MPFPIRNRQSKKYTQLRDTHTFHVPASSTKRAWIAVAVLLTLAVVAARIYICRLRGPLPGLGTGAAPNILSRLPPEAPGVGYIDVAALRKLQDSPLAAVLGLSSTDPHADQDYKNFVRDTGFDYTRDLDRAAIAFWPVNLIAPSGGSADNRVLAIGDGRFDQPKIKAYALRSGKTATRGTQTLYEVPGTPPVAFEFLSSSRIALSSGAGAEKLLGATNSSRRDSEMQSNIDRVAGSPIFAVARTDNLPESLYSNLKSSPQFEALARSVKGLTLAGQPEGNLIHITLDAECDSMKNSLELATLLDGFRIVGSMALSDPKTRRQLTPEQFALLQTLINQAKVTHLDRWVRVTVDITAAMLGDANSHSASNR
jgi:hypothetical protein